jgi:hypothetical protein
MGVRLPARSPEGVGAGPMGCRSEQGSTSDPWALKHNAPPGAQLVLGVRKK